MTEESSTKSEESKHDAVAAFICKALADKKKKKKKYERASIPAPIFVPISVSGLPEEPVRFYRKHEAEAAAARSRLASGTFLEAARNDKSAGLYVVSDKVLVKIAESFSSYAIVAYLQSKAEELVE